MKISVNWLKELLPFKWNESQLIEKLQMIGFPVENVTHTGVNLPNVVAAKILSVEKHPQADRLQIARVNDGKGERQIVCGAPNIAAGQIVPLALPGAKLKDLEIQVSTIRGVESFGMLCSERELGLSGNHAGIMMLPPNAPLGKDVGDVLGGQDTILEIEVTPNRPDVLSHVGLARELSALSGIAIKWPSSKWRAAKKGDSCKITNKEPKLCRRYLGKLIFNVNVGPSPRWMADRLTSCGIRSINNVVDITNYVLLEWGHPLHAFDLQTLSGEEIIIRRAGPDEKFLALDEKIYLLTPDDLVIADNRNVVALAGIMGGQNTGVTEKTTQVLLESAVFDPKMLRRTSQRLSLKSESSVRFEKGTDVKTAEMASLRAAQLLLELAGGTPGREADVYPQKDKPITVNLRKERMDDLIGFEISGSAVDKTLKNLGFAIKKRKMGWNCVVPAHRKDIAIEVDLIEEVLRSTGYGAVPETLPPLAINKIPADFKTNTADEAGQILKGLGFTETITTSFCSLAQAEKFGFKAEECIALRNPLSQEESIMRPAVSLTLLNAVVHNLRFQRQNVALFEVGKGLVSVKWESRPGYSTSGEIPTLAIAATGNQSDKSVHGGEKALDFFAIKGVWETLSNVFKLRGYELVYKPVHTFLHPEQSFAIQRKKDSAIIGWGGVLHPSLAVSLDILKPCVLMEIELSVLIPPTAVRATALPKFPFVERDVAILVDKNKSWAEIHAIAFKAGGHLLKNISPFDVFSGGSLDPTKKSVAFRVHLQSDDHTLTDNEINAIMDKIRISLKDQCGAQLR